MSVDPLASLTLSPYAYSESDPINGNDITGMSVWSAVKTFSDTATQPFKNGIADIKADPKLAIPVAVISLAAPIAIAVAPVAAAACLGGGCEAYAASFGFTAAGGEAEAASSDASFSTSYLNLTKQLASESQMSEEGNAMAGSGCSAAFRGAAQAARDYGGEASDWVKKSSTSFVDQTGRQMETHWIENVETGARQEFKTKLSWPKVPKLL